jgi:hypothetical protein
MARGWESKSVEEQQAEAKREPSAGATRSQAETEGRRKRDGLVLSRKNVAAQLERATSDAHRQMLERALADLDRQIAEAGPKP